MIWFVKRRGVAVTAGAVLTAALLLPAGGALAQGSDDMPTAPPWDDKAEEFFRRGDPQQEHRDHPQPDVDRATRQLYDDPLHRLGVPKNRLPDPETPDDAARQPGFDPGVSRLDRDRDGTISREEYFRDRQRYIAPGLRGDQRQKRHRERLDSRFRDADRNRDGRVTPDELQRGGRF